MYLVLSLTLSFLLLNIAHAQYFPCSCSCCSGQGCQASPLPNYVNAQQCTDASCLEACKGRYWQCGVVPPHGQAFGRCLTVTTTTTTTTAATNSPMIGGPYSCRCDCCSQGSYLCTPTLAGYTTSFSCQVGSCSIACTYQYPYVCVNSQYGQTQGACVGLVASTPTIPTGSLRCGCTCYGNNGYLNYEITTTNGCSSCYSACQSLQLQCTNHQNTYCL
jgi:hypothetical protein